MRLAIPLVLAELGWMSMAIVDTMMVGRLPNSAVAMGAVSLVSAIFIVLALFGEGLLLGLDTLVAQAFGAGKREDCHRSLINGVYLSIALTPLLSVPIFLMPRFLHAIHVDTALAWETLPYTYALTIGLFPLLLYFAVRRCLQAMNMVRPVAFALVTANIINALGNWVLIYGNGVSARWHRRLRLVYCDRSPVHGRAVLIGYLFWYDWRHRTDLLKTPVDIDPGLNQTTRRVRLAARQFTLRVEYSPRSRRSSAARRGAAGDTSRSPLILRPSPIWCRWASLPPLQCVSAKRWEGAIRVAREPREARQSL